MCNHRYRSVGLLVGCFLALASLPAWSADKPHTPKAPVIEPQAAQVLHQMADYLQGLPQFSMQADITEDVLLDSGLKIQDGRTSTVSVRRPNRLRVDSQGDVYNGQLFYNGKTIALLDVNKNGYRVVDAAPEIDAALDQAVKTYNLRVPLADLLNADVYKDLTEGAQAGFYLGLSTVQGKSCHHLAFRKKEIDWQIWIENSATPLPCKLLITDKKAKGLQFTAMLSKWNTSTELADPVFEFVPPANAQKIDLRPKAAPATSKKNVN